MGLKKRVGDFLILVYSHLILALILLTLSILYFSVKLEFPSGFQIVNELIGWLSSMIGLLTLASVIYNTELEKKRQRELKEKFRGAVSEYIQNWKKTLSSFLRPESINSESISESVTDHFFKRYSLTENIDDELEEDINNRILSELKKGPRFSEPFTLLLKYKFLESYYPDKVREFLDAINQNNLAVESSKESEFFKMLYILENEKQVELANLEQKIKSIKIADISSFIHRFIILPEVIEKLREYSKEQAQYETLKKVVDRCVLKGYVSSKGLISLLSIPSDVLCILPFEGGLKGIKYKGKEIFPNEIQTPFREVLVKRGFIKPSPFSRFMFMLPIKNIQKEYHSNIDLYIENEIIPEVKGIWAELKKKYNIKRIQEGPDYKYVAFTIYKENMRWEAVNQQFYTDFEKKILGDLDKEKTIRLLISQTHNIPDVLRKMEIDSLVDSGTDRMKEAIREKQGEINEELKNAGYEIKQVTEYRKLKDDENTFAGIIMDKGNDILNSISRVKRIDKKTSLEIANEIVTHSTDLYNLIEHLGIRI